MSETTEGFGELKPNNCKISFVCRDDRNCVYYKLGNTINGNCIYYDSGFCKSAVANVNAMIIKLKKQGIYTK